MTPKSVIDGGELDSDTGLWRYAPKKIAFIHFGKCAGVYTQKYMRNIVIPNVPQYNSWWDFSGSKTKRRFHRDWSKKELLEIAVKDIKSGFAHNHHINWCAETVKAFKDNGWFTFTFLRDPRDIICSLYFWSKSQKSKHGSEDLANPLKREIESMSGQTDPQKVSLDTFINFFLDDEDARNLWVLPDYIDEISYVKEFNDDNFKNFLLNYFHHEYVPAEKKNTSRSKGYQFYYDSGEVSEATRERLEKDVDCRKYDKFLTRRFKTLSSAKVPDLNYKAFVCKEWDYYKNGAGIFLNCVNFFGLKAEDTLLDIGCGSLRVGRHLIPFLEPENYCGIEPEEKYVRDGLEWELSDSMVKLKKPNFVFGSGFEIGSFHRKFNFVLSHAVFTHCSPDQFIHCLKNLKSCLAEDGRFVVSVKLSENTEHETWEKAKEQNIPWYKDRPYKYSDNMSTTYNIDHFDKILDENGFQRVREFSKGKWELRMAPRMTMIEIKLKR